MSEEKPSIRRTYAPTKSLIYIGWTSMAFKMLKIAKGAKRDSAGGTKGEESLGGGLEGMHYKCSNYIISELIEVALGDHCADFIVRDRLIISRPLGCAGQLGSWLSHPPRGGEVSLQWIEGGRGRPCAADEGWRLLS